MAAGLVLVVLSARLAAASEPSAEQVEFFEARVRPVLVEHCYECHSAGAEEVRGGLRVDSRDALLRGGDTGPAVVPGEPDASLLLEAVRYDGLEMPPDGRLPETVVADLESWIKHGAADPRTDSPSVAPPPAVDIEKGREFWSFRRPARQAPPTVRDAAWPRRGIDPFVLARMEEAGLAPAPAADRRTWIRRVTFDLTGLPPTPEDVAAFLEDESPRAWEAVVERLLASPHYGERWARLWLDLARYAEDQAHIVGNDKSLFYPNAWRYRDWVIRALNDDLPYDRFVRLQLAADLIAPEEAGEHVALGFLGLGPKYYGRGKLDVKAEEWEDRVDVVGRGLLGLTVACARCHDHKFDPIPTTDYYALAGVFASTEMFNRPLSEGAETKDNGQAKDPAQALHIVRDAEPTNLNVFVRGDVKNKGPEVLRHFLQVLSATSPQPFTAGSGRRELAEAIASPENPLTARVIVNRVWGAHFGRPLVGTPSNFGALGTPPTHPDLLDDLAARFMENGWSLKWLHREIVLSATYRQASNSELGARSAELLAGMPRRRLSVEQWRDAVLATTGRLDATVGGESIDPQDPEQRRRTIYSDVSRLDLNPMLALFDFPDPNMHADRRVETTTPLQKLFVLNSPFMTGSADALAERLLAEVAGSADADSRRIARAYELLYGRPATEAERGLGLEFLRAGGDPRERWREYAHVLLASNEMMFVD